MAAPFDIATSNVRVPTAPYLPDTCYCFSFFVMVILVGVKQYGFDLQFPNKVYPQPGLDGGAQLYFHSFHASTATAPSP